MPHGIRILPDNVPQHVVNRGNRKARIFWSPADYLGFIAAMADAAEKTVVRLMAFCLMPNHWHLVFWPHTGREISNYMQIMMNSHLRDLLPRNGLVGSGHVYKGRFRNHPIHNERHFLNVCRYVESNALRANLIERAEDWPWSSLACEGPAPGINLLARPWPVPRPKNWIEQVNTRLEEAPIPKAWTTFERPATREDAIRAIASPTQLEVTRTQSTRIVTLSS